MSTLEVEADVSESNIYKVKLNQPCEIVLDAYPSVKFEGYVKKIVPTADRSRATVMTKIAFRKLDDRVLPEMSARVNFMNDATKAPAEQVANVIVLPKTAVTNREGRKVVFKVNGSYVQESLVETGRELGSVVEIVSGVSVGDIVVLSPAGGMKTGDKIEVTQ
jgi:hypothetical protein